MPRRLAPRRVPRLACPYLSTSDSAHADRPTARRAQGRVRPVQLAPPIAPPPLLPSILGGSEVYRIGADNFPQRIWQHAQDVVYAVGFDSQGTPDRRDGQ